MPKKTTEHWDRIWGAKTPDQVSWHEAEPRLSLELIQATGVGPASSERPSRRPGGQRFVGHGGRSPASPGGPGPGLARPRRVPLSRGTPV